MSFRNREVPDPRLDLYYKIRFSPNENPQVTILLTRRYPFGSDDQILYWDAENQDVLLEFCEGLHDRVRARALS